MGKYYDAALVLRGIMDKAGAMLTDEQAATVQGLFPAWNAEATCTWAGDASELIARLLFKKEALCTVGDRVCIVPVQGGAGTAAIGK